MRKDRSIVIGIDGSQETLAAVRWAAEEAVRHGARLRLCHGLREPAVPATAPEDLRFHHSWCAAWSWLERAEAAALAVDADLDISFDVRPDDAASVLARAARHADMVVLGHRNPQGPTVDTAALRVAARVETPVVLVPSSPGDGHDPAGPVVVGVDGVPDSAPALAFAFAEARAHDAAIEIVYTRGQDAAFYAEEPFLIDWRQVCEAERADIDRHISRLRGQYPGQPSELISHSPPPGPETADLPRAARLLVVSTWSHRATAGAALGPTGGGLLTQVTCPVVLVHALNPTANSRRTPGRALPSVGHGTAGRIR